MNRPEFMAATVGAFAVAALPIQTVAPRPLQIYSDEYEWWAAHDYADLKAQMVEMYGADFLRDYDSVEEAFIEQSLEKTSSVWFDEETQEVTEHGSGKLTKRTNREWLDLLGRGYLWGTEG